ncbi:hypothetical protein CJ195_04150 [Bacillus sp. UMB0899]|uniref:hypothetical protein n=1 Tax=Metabacillus schmidteae TaxID=2730405 RepID=UPI000C8072C1|nr:hypothetical protein [Metabacillus schmidteae]PMC39139.1 hypothetical protein CJ195_04150 [Bacillus sp. UMB0899]
MNYLTVNQISQSQASIEAKTYLKELWYAIVEGHFAMSRHYRMYKYQLLHLQASAPEDWQLEWNGIQFTLTKDFEHHARVTLMLRPNGSIQYYFS